MPFSFLQGIARIVASGPGSSPESTSSTRNLSAYGVRGSLISFPSTISPTHTLSENRIAASNGPREQWADAGIEPTPTIVLASSTTSTDLRGRRRTRRSYHAPVGRA